MGMTGKLIIFSAPSGSGKTTIVKEVLKKLPGLEFSVSACSRKPRPNEENGRDYYFLTKKNSGKVLKIRNLLNGKKFIQASFTVH